MAYNNMVNDLDMLLYHLQNRRKGKQRKNWKNCVSFSFELVTLHDRSYRSNNAKDNQR